MRRLRSPCTVEVYGVVTSCRDELVLVMEYMSGGDLFAYIRKHRETKEKIPEQVCFSPFGRNVSLSGWLQLWISLLAAVMESADVSISTARSGWS